MEKPLISIIIPVLNNFDGLQKSIESIKKQLFTNYEVWVIDGESDERTLSYLSALKFPFQFISEKDNGIYDAMNKGIQLVKGEWLYFLGSGDVLYNENVLNNIFGSKTYHNYKIISGKVLYEGENSPFIYNKNKREKEPSWSLLMWVRNGLHHQGTFYRKCIFKDYIYSNNYQILSDYYLNLVLFKQGFSCKIVPLRIAVCDSNGISKQGRWLDYKEEIRLKKELSSVLLQPFFYFVSLAKFIFSKF